VSGKVDTGHDFAGSKLLDGAGLPSGSGRLEELPAGLDTPGPVPDVEARPGNEAALLPVAALAACGIAMVASSVTSSVSEVRSATDRARRDVKPTVKPPVAGMFVRAISQTSRTVREGVNGRIGPKRKWCSGSS